MSSMHEDIIKNHIAIIDGYTDMINKTLKNITVMNDELNDEKWDDITDYIDFITEHTIKLAEMYRDSIHKDVRKLKKSKLTVIKNSDN